MDRRKFVCACGGFSLGVSQLSRAITPGMPEEDGSTKVELPKAGPKPALVGGATGSGGTLQAALAASKGCSRIRFGTKEDTGTGPLRRTSGVPILDNMLAQESERLSAMFETRPGVAWFVDEGSGNAFATPEQFLGSADGTIAMGIRLSINMILRYGQGLGVYSSWIAMAVLAHEFGHITQFKRLESHRLRHTSKYPELHADFLAGAYMAQRALEAYRFNGTDLMPALNTAVHQFFTLGDTSFHSRDHHGTGTERARAFSGGVLLTQRVATSGGHIAFEEVFNVARQAAGY